MRPTTFESYRTEGYKEVTTTYQQLPSDFVLVGNVAGAGFTITLCQANQAVIGKLYTIRKTGGGTNQLTVALPTGSIGDLDLIGTAPPTMEDDGDRSAFMSDGIAWYLISAHRAD